jgi:hypothetical protein
MNGTNDKENLVKLTPEEHYVAHQLLVKIHPGNHSLAKAAAMMTVNRTTNKIYGWVRRRFAESMKESQRGHKNSQYQSRWIYSVALQQCKKIPKDDPIPDGWEIGRIMDFDKLKLRSEKKQKVSKRKKRKIVERSRKEKAPRLDKKLINFQNSQRNAQEWYAKLLASNANSLRSFVSESDYPYSHVAFIRMLKKYIPGFNPTHGQKFDSKKLD